MTQNISDVIYILEQMRNNYGDIPVIMMHEWESNFSINYQPKSEFTWGIHGETDVMIAAIVLSSEGSEGIQSRYNKKGYPK